MQLIRLLLLFVLLAPLPLWAQQRISTEESGGFLVDFLEEQLSGDNRAIRVEGLSGGFSSKAELKRLTIADDKGVWLEIEEATLDWTRSALLRGALSINQLSARRIAVLRAPEPAPVDPELPAPETAPFRLPDLPVSILLNELRAEEIELGESLLGQQARLRVDGRIELADGTLSMDLSGLRLDRQGDQLTLKVGFDNETEELALDLSLDEQAGGLIGRLLELPGGPSLQLNAEGSGPLRDFTADLGFATDGIERLSGQVRLEGADPTTSTTGLVFRADLNGNIDPLLPERFHPFFGPGLRLRVKGETFENDGLALHSLALTSRALRLSGSLMMRAGALETANLRSTITAADPTSRVILPIPGEEISIKGMSLQAQKPKGRDWNIAARIGEFAHPQIAIADLSFKTLGTLEQSLFDLVADVNLTAKGVQPNDPNLRVALGPEIVAQTRLELSSENARATQLQVKGDGYQLSGEMEFEGLQDGLKVIADLKTDLNDLAQFEALAGVPLGGSVIGTAQGSFTPLTGGFDVVSTLTAQDLRLGQAQLDPLLVGTSNLTLSARRDVDGLVLEQLSLSSSAFQSDTSGRLDSQNGQLSLTARLNDLATVVAGISGPVTLAADIQKKGTTVSGNADLQGPLSTTARISGEMQEDGSADVQFSSRLGELQGLIPELAGVVTAEGRASRSEGIWQINSNATGPAALTAAISGSWDEATARADLAAQGAVQMSVVNPFLKPNLLDGQGRFNLSLSGPPSLDALRGTVQLADTRLVLPSAGQELRNIAATVTLNGAGADIQARAQPRSGGKINIRGPIAIQPPFDGALTIDLADVVLSDNLIYETKLSGDLSLTGALVQAPQLSGTIDVQETTLNLASAGGAVGAAPIPLIQHQNEPRAVRQTRQHAGLLNTSSGSSANLALDLLIRAPNRIFARGRGLRAELGGELRLRGTSADPVPSGQIGLLRGTFDILGRRLSLDDGQITLLGSLIPYLSFTASTTTEQGSASLMLQGPANAPTIEVTSEPNRPSEEALALLLFGDNIQDISPLALARLAASVARLSGRSDGVSDSLRDSTGAETVDVGVDNLGAGELGLGGYISQNVYTDLNVNTRGESELSINLDLSPSVTVTGTADSAGETGVGLFFKRDY
ncbi:autotransporter secretion inner membrane protein TamB [Epibacterium ulvae]|uniref:Autotransporter secretion inner membrane protein TamB n=1 Tax=Epibacterium ulvae TaxID=1156985 RepID=A0A1G5PMM3_9RHOB|nr:translocation/assembly module TamB domain-containing protein [Epibacterium ulvae]SCZ50785.1 autotransporter secretion inner membrane protein TamB [Epibacterium ulvae]